jgi:DNA-directed RNA polymerase omega subunit
MSVKITNTIERYNVDNCIKPFEGNRFRMILAAATRAREIANQRTMMEKNGVKIKYDNKPAVETLCEIDQGVFGAEYLNKIK